MEEEDHNIEKRRAKEEEEDRHDDVSNLPDDIIAQKLSLLSMEEEDHNIEKRFKEEQEEHQHDHISDLPNKILAHILALFMDTREAIAKSTLLSSRWRYLWKYTRDLYFYCYPHMDEPSFPNFVSRVLDLRQGGIPINSFILSFNYKNEDAHQVDSWVRYIATQDIRDLTLNFAGSDRMFNSALLEANWEPYKLPPSLFHRLASLESLGLKFCKLEIPPSPSSWFSILRLVHLMCVTLEGGAIENLTSNSPCLRDLLFHNCKWAGEINIEHAKLQTLSVLHRVEEPAGDITIHAPNLSTLALYSTTFTGRHRIKDLSSLNMLILDFKEMLDREYNQNDGDRLVELLGCLSHVRVLRLCGWCVQVLARRSVVGSIQHLNNPPLNVVELCIATNSKEWGFHGIAYLLKSCPELQKLIMHRDVREGYELSVDFLDYYNFDGKKYWRVQEMSSFVMEHLKIVDITGFMRYENIMTEEVPKSVKDEIEFVKFLLKRSVALEKMTFRYIGEEGFDRLLQKSKPLNKIVQELLIFPKASLKAKIILL